MRLDHLAFRVFDREQFAQTMSWFGYHRAQEFMLFDGAVRSYALQGPGPEIFVSEGAYKTVVGEWVLERGDGLHHVAFEVDDVPSAVEDLPFDFGPIITCKCEKPLIQTFSKLTEFGFIFELLTKNGHPGFCRGNVEKLMEASRDLE